MRRVQKTVVLVTHSLNEASYLGDHVYLLKDGEVVQSGSFQDIYKNPKDEFVKEFINAQIPIDP